MPDVMLVAEMLAEESDAPPACLRVAPAADDVSDYLHDESKLSARSVASLAVPRDVADLREVLRWHALRGNRIAVSGGRTGVTGGAVPESDAHVVSLFELRGIVRVDGEAEPPTATVLGGTWLSELNAHLATHHPGLIFPVDPTETSASLGGMVATNAAGARSYRFGAMRRWVEALTIELASGRTLQLRRGGACSEGGAVAMRDGDDIRALQLPAIPKPVTKNAIGYGFGPDGDVIDLFIGSEGTLGVVSEVTVRLFRQEELRMGFLQFFADAQTAFRFVDGLRAERTLRTTAIEFLDARSHALARESGKPAVERVLQLAPRDACSVFTEIAWNDEDELASIVERLEELVAAVGGDVSASLAGASEDELRDIRVFRHAVPERANAIIAQRRDRHPGLHKIATDMAVTDPDLPWVYELFTSRLTAAGLDHAVFGHVGNNHFHVNILPRDESELARAKELYAGFAREIVDRGGCVAAEHGIGRIKKRFLSVQYSSEVMERFRTIKRWADPHWRLNPGVLIDP